MCMVIENGWMDGLAYVDVSFNIDSLILLSSIYKNIQYIYEQLTADIQSDMTHLFPPFHLLAYNHFMAVTET